LFFSEILSVDDCYPVFLDENMNSSSYEDSLRKMFDIHAYSTFTWTYF